MGDLGTFVIYVGHTDSAAEGREGGSNEGLKIEVGLWRSSLKLLVSNYWISMFFAHLFLPPYMIVLKLSINSILRT